MTNILEKARAFAEKAHADQKRKYTGEPYLVHCLEVANIVRTAGGSDEMIAAAWLHDTVEDTPTTLVDIKREFGNEVAELVYWLTDVSTHAQGNRAFRKKIDREHSGMAPPRAQTIKLADILSNTKDIVPHDPGFGRVYIKEMILLLPMLGQGNNTLWNEAMVQVQAAAKELGIYETEQSDDTAPG